MFKRLIVPGLFIAAFIVVYGQALAVFAPVFLETIGDPHAKGQALRAALYWCSMETLIPLAGALAGAMVGAGVCKFKERRRTAISETPTQPPAPSSPI